MHASGQRALLLLAARLSAMLDDVTADALAHLAELLEEWRQTAGTFEGSDRRSYAAPRVWFRPLIRLAIEDPGALPEGVEVVQAKSIDSNCLVLQVEGLGVVRMTTSSGPETIFGAIAEACERAARSST